MSGINILHPEEPGEHLLPSKFVLVLVLNVVAAAV
jgi:hypothetical protein